MDKPTAGEVVLRDVEEDDLPIFFDYQREPDAIQMAAFTVKDPDDRATFRAHWDKILSNESIAIKTILFNGQVAGNVLSFEQFDEREVSYWIGKEFWGKGIATKALSEFLEYVTERPLYARAAKDNVGSLRVLEKCGFTIAGEDKGFANARGEEVEEYILKFEA